MNEIMSQIAELEDIASVSLYGPGHREGTTVVENIARYKTGETTITVGEWFHALGILTSHTDWERARRVWIVCPATVDIEELEIEDVVVDGVDVYGLHIYTREAGAKEACDRRNRRS